MFSRIRLIADQLKIALDDDDEGAVVFKEGTVQGVSGLVLEKLRVGDLSVNTIHLADACVTIPTFDQLGSDYTQTGVFGDATTNYTFVEQDIVTTAPAGSLIYLMCLSQLFGDITSVTPSNVIGILRVRALINNSQVLAAFTIVDRTTGGVRTQSNPNRLFMSSVVATGVPQTINVKWNAILQTSFATNTGDFQINAGSRVLTIGMKR